MLNLPCVFTVNIVGEGCVIEELNSKIEYDPVEIKGY
jgi:hypothetical protein